MVINRELYSSIRNQLVFKSNNKLTLFYILLDLILAATGLWMVQQDSIVYFILSQILFCIVILQSFILLHEAGHYTCVSSRKLNVVLGHYFSILCCMPFYPWTYIHFEHHKWTGHIDKDPVFELLKRARASNSLPWLLRFGWRSFLPFGVFFMHLVYWSYPLKLLKEKKMNKAMLRRTLFSVLFLVCVYSILFYGFSSVFKIKYFILPAIGYGMLWELLTTAQHLGLPSFTSRPQLHQHAQTTRSTIFPYFLGKYVFLNFGLHLEHHFYPALPWHELSKARELLKPELKEQYNEVIGGVWNFKTRQQDMRVFLGLNISERK